LYEYGTCNYYGYYDGSAGEYDGAIHNMVSDIKRLKEEVMEYRKLKGALKPIVGRR
jgi:hypothetical protein